MDSADKKSINNHGLAHDVVLIQMSNVVTLQTG
jgi:hypothetical protein